MGFTMTGADDSPHGSEPSPADDGHIDPELPSVDVANDPPDLLPALVTARITPPTPALRSLAVVALTPSAATAEIGVGMGHFFGNPLRELPTRL
jgi:hypothetical protein